MMELRKKPRIIESTATASDEQLPNNDTLAKRHRIAKAIGGLGLAIIVNYMQDGITHVAKDVYGYAFSPSSRAAPVTLQPPADNLPDGSAYSGSAKVEPNCVWPGEDPNAYPDLGTLPSCGAPVESSSSNNNETSSTITVSNNNNVSVNSNWKPTN